MIAIVEERPGDGPAIERLLTLCFGHNRIRKAANALRHGNMPIPSLSLIALANGSIVGTTRSWPVQLGGDPSGVGDGRLSLLLGPVAVGPAFRGSGIGGRLIQESLSRSVKAGFQSIILIGDAPYYQRFGFAQLPAGGLSLPGPVDPDRFLGLEIVAGALMGARGLVQAAPVPPSAIPCGLTSSIPQQYCMAPGGAV